VYVCWVSGIDGDTPKSAKYQQNSKIEMCIYTNLKKDARHFEKNEHVHSFENVARLSRVHDASITLPCYSMRLTNRDACDAREKRLVWH